MNIINHYLEESKRRLLKFNIYYYLVKIDYANEKLNVLEEKKASIKSMLDEVYFILLNISKSILLISIKKENFNGKNKLEEIIKNGIINLMNISPFDVLNKGNDDEKNDNEKNDDEKNDEKKK